MAASAEISIWCKICGITNARDAQAAEHYGADAIGLNFYPRSPRVLDLDVAEQVLNSVAITKVALFVDPQEQDVQNVLALGGVDMLQFHGDESAEFCASFGMPYMKAVRVHAHTDIDMLASAYKDAWALLLDTFVPAQPGGTGHTFDWRLWPAGLPQRGVLAGGLDASNVARAIQQTNPFGVDLSSGVEGVDKRRKDHGKIKDFLAAVAQAGPDLNKPENAGQQ